MAKDVRCRLLFLWFGGSQAITQLTVISAWCHLILEASRGKWSGQQRIRIYHLLSDQFRTAKDFPFPETPKEFTIDSEDEDEGEVTSGFPEPRACTDKAHVSHDESSASHIVTQNELIRSCSRSATLLEQSRVTGIKISTVESSRRKCPNYFVS